MHIVEQHEILQVGIGSGAPLQIDFQSVAALRDFSHGTTEFLDARDGVVRPFGRWLSVRRGADKHDANEDERSKHFSSQVNDPNADCGLA